MQVTLSPANSHVQLGSALDIGGQEYLVNLVAAHALMHERDENTPTALPCDMRLLLEMGEPGLDTARKALAFAASELAAPAALALWTAEGTI